MTDVSWLGPPIDVRPLFAKQQAAFIDLLRHLDTEQWAQPTICPGWDVKDIAAHVLSEQLSIIGDQIVEFWQTVDLNALGGRVSWAGPQPAPVWLDAARDFTEYWAHHPQICDATNRTGLTDPRYLGPVLDTFMRALPHTLRNMTAPDGTALQVIVTGPSGGEWSCTRSPDRWRLQRQPHPQPAARLELDEDTTWRLCTRGITPERAAEHAHIDGDQHLATAALQIVSIIWTPPNPEAFGEF